MNGMYKGVGEGRGGRETKGGLRLSLRDRSSTVCSVSGTSSYNPQHRPGQPLDTVWHHTHPY